MTPPRVGLVVGGASEIGNAISEALAGSGHEVISADREPAQVHVDVDDPASVSSCMSEVVERFGMPRVLVYNAAWRERADALQISTAQWDRTFSTTVRGAFLCAQQFARPAAEREPTPRAIVFVASQLGIVSSPGLVAYGAAKAALMQLTKTLAAEWADRDLTVSCVAPGPVRSPVVERSIAQSPRGLAGMTERMMMNRLVEPAEVAAAVAYLASEPARMATGSTLILDGGWTSV